MVALCRSTSTRSRRSATRAAARAVGARCGARVRRCRRAGHHRASARRRAAHHVRRRARGRGVAAAAGWPRRVQHRRRSAAGSARAGARGEADAVHAGAGAARRDHQPGRLVAGHAARSDGRRRRSRCATTASASACSWTRKRTPIRWAADMGADRVELYTEPFARAFERGQKAAAGVVRGLCARGRRWPHSLGLGVNAGHDLDLDNLQHVPALPHLDEVSIGHALDQPRAVRRPRAQRARVSGVLAVNYDRARTARLSASGGSVKIRSVDP